MSPYQWSFALFLQQFVHVSLKRLPTTHFRSQLHTWDHLVSYFRILWFYLLLGEQLSSTGMLHADWGCLFQSQHYSFGMVSLMVSCGFSEDVRTEMLTILGSLYFGYAGSKILKQIFLLTWLNDRALFSLNILQIIFMSMYDLMNMAINGLIMEHR